MEVINVHQKNIVINKICHGAGKNTPIGSSEAIQALLREFSVQEIGALQRTPHLVSEIYRVISLDIPAAQKELLKTLNLQTEHYPDITGMAEDSFYITSNYPNTTRPSWARAKVFSVGYYSDSFPDLLYTIRRLLLMRVRLSLWSLITEEKVAEHKAKEQASRILPPTDPGMFGNYM